jgi:hypothetical protein
MLQPVAIPRFHPHRRPERQLCRLFLSLLDKLGMPLAKFGDAKVPLGEFA